MTTRTTPPASRPRSVPRGLVVEHLGTLDYETALHRQHQHADRVRCHEAPPVLMLVEHPAVYTAGRRTRPEHLPHGATPVVPVDRGGTVTWHGPGQLVGYPILELADHVQVTAYVDALENALVRACASVGVTCTGGPPGRRGVWIADNSATARKVAAIGIRIRDGVTTHGFALNCDPDLDAFNTIVPCGISDAAVTSLTYERGHPVTTERMRDVVARETRRALTPLIANH